MTVDVHPRTLATSGSQPPTTRWVVEVARLAPVRDTLIVLALLGVAAVLSAPALGPSSLWVDDSWIALVHRLSRPEDVLATGLSSPGFALLLKGAFAAVGFSEVVAQALPFAAGVVLPAAVYVVGRRIGLTAVGAGVAAAVVLLSPVRIEYAGRVKPFTVDALAATILVWLAWRTAERPGARRRWFVLTAFGLSATVVSASSAVVSGPVMVGAGLAAWRTPAWPRARRWIIGYAAAAGAWVLGVVAPRLGPELHEYWAGRYVEGPADVWRVVRAFAADLAGLEHAVAVGVVTVLLALSFALAARRRLWQAAILAGPALAAVVLATAQRAPLGTGRTDLYLYPTLALAVAWALDHLPGSRTMVSPRRWASLLALAGLAVAAVPPPMAGYPAEEFRPLTAAIERHLGPDDLVLVTGSTVYGVALYGPWTAGIEPAATTTGFTPVFDDARIRRAPGPGQLERLPAVLRDVPAGGRVWLFSSRTSDEAGAELREGMVDAGWELDRRSVAEGATLERWRRPGD